MPSWKNSFVIGRNWYIIMKLQIMLGIVFTGAERLALLRAGCLRALLFAMLSGQPSPETSYNVLTWQVYLDASQQTNEHWDCGACVPDCGKWHVTVKNSEMAKWTQKCTCSLQDVDTVSGRTRLDVSIWNWERHFFSQYFPLSFQMKVYFHSCSI